MTYFIILMLLFSASAIITPSCTAFHIKTANVTNVYDIHVLEKLSEFYHYGSSQTQRKIFMDSFVKGDATDISKFKNTQLIPYIFLGSIFVIIYVILIICCLCEKTCKGWRRRRPYVVSQRRTITIFTAVFLLFVILISLPTSVSLIKLVNSVNSTRCSFEFALDTAINGDNYLNEWIGFNNFQNLVTNISESFNSTVSSIKTNIGINNLTQFTDRMNLQITRNIDIYTKYQNMLLNTPDPQSSNKIKSMFIQQRLGPITQNGTMTYDINNALGKLNIMVKSATTINTSAKIIVDSSDIYRQNLQNSMIKITSFNANLKNQYTKLRYYTDSYIFQIFDHRYLLDITLFILSIVCMVGLVGVIETHYFEQYNHRIYVTMTWILSGFVYIGVVYFAYSLFYSGVVSNQICKHYSQILSYDSSYDKKNTMNNLKSCLYGDGNVLKMFGIDSQMKSLIYLYKNISYFESLNRPGSQNFVSLTDSRLIIDNWLNELEKYRDGIYIDSNSSDYTNANPKIALQSMNKYTLMKLFPIENCTQDHWVFNEVNCMMDERVYSPSIDSTNGLTINVSSFCLSFNSAINQSQLANKTYWTQIDFVQRYREIVQDCPQSFNQIVKYGKSLINYRDSRIKLFQSIIDDLKLIKPLNYLQVDQIAQFLRSISNFINNTKTMNSFLTKRLGGISSTNCKIIGDSLRLIYNAYCINYMLISTEICLALILLSIFALPAIFTSYCFSMVYLQVSRREQRKQARLQRPHQLVQQDSDIQSDSD